MLSYAGMCYHTLHITLTYYLVRKYAVWDAANKNKMASFFLELTLKATATSCFKEKRKKRQSAKHQAAYSE